MHPNELHIDLETRSIIDLTKQGVYVYAEHKSTEILICSYALGNEEPKTWFPCWGEPVPDDLLAAILDPKTVFAAHNAMGFEYVMLQVVARRHNLLPPAALKALADRYRWTCTAARAAANGLPRDLDGAAVALRLSLSKDKEGASVMKELCAPRKILPDGTLVWEESPAKILRLAAYCEIDVRVERSLSARLPELSVMERDIWIATERMNARGIQLDGPFVERMVQFVAEAEEEVNKKLTRLTNGQVTKVTQTKRMKDWLEGFDYNLADMGKNTLKELLDKDKNYEDELKKNGGDPSLIDDAILDGRLPDHIKEVLLLRKNGGKSSAGKYKSAISRRNSDDRARGAIMYSGAPATKRASARGLQVQNLSRGGGIKNLDIDSAIEDIMNGMSVQEIESKYGPPIVLASDLVRPSFKAKHNHWLPRGDYSQIEARMSAWIADQHEELAAFRLSDTGEGPDLYKVTAKNILSILWGRDVSYEEIDKLLRQTYGKVPSLACGFGGGPKAFAAFAKLYGVNISEDQQQRIVAAYRSANHAKAVGWYCFNRAALECLKGEPGEEHWVCTRDGDERLTNPSTGLPLIGNHVIRPRVYYKRYSDRMRLFLPSGGYLTYWYPELEYVPTPWGKDKAQVTFKYIDPQSKQFWKTRGYGGFFFQNCVQAMARDVAMEAMVRLEEAKFNPVLTVHDEIVCEVSMEAWPYPEEAAKAIGDIMGEPVKWAPGLPLAVSATCSIRYTKDD
jgi:DNA polymerase